MKQRMSLQNFGYNVSQGIQVMSAILWLLNTILFCKVKIILMVMFTKQYIPQFKITIIYSN